MELKFNDKVALVTGAARDVGREIALTLAAEGAKVAVNYGSSGEEAEAVVKQIQDAGGTAKAYQADVGDYAAVQAMVAQILADFGQIDVLVNNAGLVLPRKFIQTGPEEWKRQIDVGLYGVIHCCHAVVPHMIERETGSIVNLTGDSARVGEANLSITASSRGGAISLTKSLARELGPFNITVNAVAFGLLETAHTDQAFLEKYMDKILRQYPIKRLGRPTDVAPTVVFLASGASEWVTGQVISVNGGYSMVG